MRIKNKSSRGAPKEGGAPRPPIFATFENIREQVKKVKEVEEAGEAK